MRIKWVKMGTTPRKPSYLQQRPRLRWDRLLFLPGLWPFLPLAFLSHCPSAGTSGSFESFSHSSLDNLVWSHSSWKEETKTELTNKAFNKNPAHLRNDGHLVPHTAPFLTITLNLSHPIVYAPVNAHFSAKRTSVLKLWLLTHQQEEKSYSVLESRV